jgi:hypothetical protein
MTVLKKQETQSPFTKAQLLDVHAKSDQWDNWKQQKEYASEHVQDKRGAEFMKIYFRDMEELASLAEKMSKRKSK